MPEGSSLWLFDSVSLSNFAMAGRLDVLAKRYRRRGALTTQVLDEIVHGVAAGYGELEDVYGLIDRGVFRKVVLRKQEFASYRRLIQMLGDGEASVIAAASERGGTVVTDDRAARKVCRELSLPLTGTIVILLACVRDDTLPLDEADALLGLMVEAGFYSPVSRISDIL